MLENLGKTKEHYTNREVDVFLLFTAQTQATPMVSGIYVSCSANTLNEWSLGDPGGALPCLSWYWAPRRGQAK